MGRLDVKGTSFKKQRVAWAWGSRSTKRVGLFLSASIAERFTAVVVFPTPPLVFVIARIIWFSPFISYLEKSQLEPAKRDSMPVEDPVFNGEKGPSR